MKPAKPNPTDHGVKEMDCRAQRTGGKLKLAAGIVLALIACAAGTGCANSSSSDWAQTAPVLRADRTSGSSAVHLGLRGG